MPDDQVTVTAQHTVRCADETSLAALPSPMKLGPMDQLVLPFVPIAVVYVYRRPATMTTDLIPIERLQHALSLLLNHYPHLTGRLQINPLDHTPEIVQLGAGVHLLEAHCAAPLSAFHAQSTHPTGRITILNLPAGGNALLAPFDASLAGVCRDPVLTVQHTRFACGGVALGVRAHHIVCDSDGFFRLVRDLAAVYRDGSALACPPCIRSLLADGVDARDREEALSYQPRWFHLEEEEGGEEGEEEKKGEAGESRETAPPAADPASAPPPSPHHPVVGRTLRFPGTALAALKARATPLSGESWISTFDALSAHLFQRIYRARLQLLCTTEPPSTLSSAAARLSRLFLTSVNLRGAGRLGADLPPRYFPNAVVCPHGDVPHDTLADGPLWEVARRVHDITRSVDAEDVRKTLRWIAAQPDKRRIKTGFSYSVGSFVVSQWCKFDMYAGADFDVDGRGERVQPALVAPPFTPISSMDGLAFFLATEEQVRQGRAAADGQAGGDEARAIDVNLALSEPLWDILDRDEGFQEFRHE